MSHPNPHAAPTSTPKPPVGRIARALKVVPLEAYPVTAVTALGVVLSGYMIHKLWFSHDEITWNRRKPLGYLSDTDYATEAQKRRREVEDE